ncbi:hypothetical protein M569_08099, partial [Genlisea aurea]
AGVTSFRLVNRRKLIDCPDLNPYLGITIVSESSLPDNATITVTVSGVIDTQSTDWVGLMSPSTADHGTCLDNKAKYVETGDLASLPLLCDYPVKSQYVSNDPAYLPCNKSTCQETDSSGACIVTTCSGDLVFHVVNIRTDLKAVFFGGGYDAPCVLTTSQSVPFANPSQPLYAHINSIDSTGTSMRVTWVSGDGAAQQVQYGNGQTVTSTVTTFSSSDMCTDALVPSPAVDFGWHDPGFIHSAVMTGLSPSTSYTYRYGSDAVGWSDTITFRTPPAAGASALNFLAFGDLGKAPLDMSDEHYIQPGSVSVIDAVAGELNSGTVDSIFHIGDISYATGFLVEWDFFLSLISPVASTVSYMTAIGNHERDFTGSGSVYETPDSGGECGVAYETYFPMPTQGFDKPWYSIEQGPVHFTIISTEHDWSPGSEQYQWMTADMASVDRKRTPWLIFQGHRPFYTSTTENPVLPNVDSTFVSAIEPLLLNYKVDLALVGHVHNYERTCALYNGQCFQMPTKDADGVDTFNFTTYPAPVHAVIGMAGFTLDGFAANNKWSLSQQSVFGYSRFFATTTEIRSQFVAAGTNQVLDSFKIIK